jgi:hypothetical protein
MNDHGINAPAPPAPLSADQIRAYLDYFLAELVRKRDDELIPALKNWGTPPKGREFVHIPDGDEDGAGIFTENQAIARALLGTLEDRRQEVKAPFLKGGKTVDEWCRDFKDKLTEHLIPIDRALMDYTTRKDAIETKRREEAARIAREEENRRIAEAQAALAREAPEATIAHKLDAASKASGVADRAEQAAINPRGGRSVKGIYGGRVTQVVSWEWEIEDLSKVPPEGLMVNPDWVKEMARERDPNTRRPLKTIPGIKWVEYRTLGTVKKRITP